MFAGHLAVALGARAAEPRVPLSVLVAASYGLDLLWPVFLLTGIEQVRIDPGNTAFTPLDFVSYPWSHSLLFAAIWSAAAALVGRRFTSWRGAAVVGAVVFSHWVLDYVTHRADLPLWPNGPEVGLGLWWSVAGTIVVEGGLFLLAVAAYRRAWRPRDRAGALIFGLLAAFIGVIWITQPFSPPPPNAMAVAVVALGLWLLPAWAHWAERHIIRA